ncbi:hypothetical protein D7004_01995 [Pedobacter jejuensis]|uniref:DUF4292 domain-containing protein n=2 Tax=Pedobacter jejuensis TaxID=1268550 RepID=A0A3N0C2F4_9SPHI|nr:hypothetical protein D7004_01995 [Pedobacter jejuensis]
MFALRDKSAPKIFSFDQLSGLPSPVEKYFRLVLKEGQHYPGTIRLKHGGQFKTGLDKPWITIKGEQYFTTLPPGFIWKGSTKLFSARDMYIGTKGMLEVFLLDALKIVNGRGEKFDQGELLRWLAESVWFPTNFLQDENKHWFPVDSKTARLKVKVDGLDLSYLVSFHDKGEITTLSTKRYMGEKLETWMISLSGYSEINSVSIPLLAEASWKIDGKMIPYARFEVQEIEYDMALRY